MYRSFELSSEIIEARWKFPVSVTWNVSLASPDNGETWFQGFKSLKRFNDIQERDERGGVRIFGKLIFLTTNPTNSTVVSPHKDRWPFMEACARLWHFKYPPNGTRVAFPLAELPWTWFDRSFVVTRKILSSVDSYTGQPSYYDFDDHFLGKIWKFHIYLRRRKIFNASSSVGSHVTQKKIPLILESIQFANIFELNVEARMSQFWYEISSQLSTPFKSAEFTSRITFTKIDIAYL